MSSLMVSPNLAALSAFGFARHFTILHNRSFWSMTHLELRAAVGAINVSRDAIQINPD
jgi:hypothetical protein